MKTRTASLLTTLAITGFVAISFNATSAFAANRGGNENEQRHHDDGNGHGPGEGGQGVPELDTSVAGSAAVLVGGGLLVMLGKKRRGQKKA